MRWSLIVGVVAVSHLGAGQPVGRLAEVQKVHIPIAAARPLESGKPIPIGVAPHRGPLAAGLSSHPIAAVRISGATQPDLFVMAGRFSFPPGLFLYPWRATTLEGVPVFGERIPVRFPATPEPHADCAIFEEASAIHGLFLDRQDLVHALYHREKREFIEQSRLSLRDLPRRPSAFTVLRNPDGALELLFHIGDGVEYRPTDFDWRDPRYVPYDGAGIWRGGLPYLALYAVTRPDLSSGPIGKPRLVSRTTREVLWGNSGLAIINLGPQHRRDIVSGSRFGDLYYYRNAAATGLDLESRRHIVGTDGNALRHPTVGASPTAYPSPQTGLADLIAGGEGALYFYRFTGRFNREGQPVYHAPVPVLEREADLYSGSLASPTQVDWDGDGALDIIAGNSEGFVLFFRNAGSNAAPAFLPGVALRAGGELIHIQPGYKGDIQGPAEARWGYVSANVTDWNGDGLPDILMSDSTAQHRVFLNRGTPGSPKLAPGRTLYLDGLDLHGTWRVRPGVAKLNGRMAYVANDDQDAFHLYWRIDDYNLLDGGKLRLEDGSAIGANYTGAGGTGRTKLELVDWDQDSLTDLLVGTTRAHSVPNPETGLPRAMKPSVATVLFLKNVNTNAAPRFRFPVALAHRGEPISHGAHEITVTAGKLGGGDGPNLVVSREDGRLIFYQREFLSPR
ncbi:MAG: VCBS repeat-containing protein [Acidobacteria bacterium]|nr:VCBS repeat-containing protein [Acidobacteriota bacterium]